MLSGQNRTGHYESGGERARRAAHGAASSLKTSNVGLDLHLYPLDIRLFVRGPYVFLLAVTDTGWE